MSNGAATRIPRLYESLNPRTDLQASLKLGAEDRGQIQRRKRDPHGRDVRRSATGTVAPPGSARLRNRAGIAAASAPAAAVRRAKPSPPLGRLTGGPFL
jgi:hypothetical protein